MKKAILIVATLLAAETVLAKDLVFTLYCKQEEARVGAPLLRVYKTAKKVRGKWDYDYTVGVQAINPGVKEKTYKVVSAQSGDEDYNEFKVIGAKGIQGAYIQNAFKWARLVDDEGSGFAYCEPAGKK